MTSTRLHFWRNLPKNYYAATNIVCSSQQLEEYISNIKNHNHGHNTNHARGAHNKSLLLQLLLSEERTKFQSDLFESVNFYRVPGHANAVKAVVKVTKEHIKKALIREPS